MSFYLGLVGGLIAWYLIVTIVWTLWTISTVGQVVGH